MTENLLTNDIPEKFKDPETGALRADALLRSYKELEKKLSQNPSAPKSPDDYCIDCSHGLFEPDADINSRMHAKGFTQDQAQELYNLAAEKMMPMIAEIFAELQADREVERLVNHFGGVEKWKEVSRQLLAFGRQNVKPEVLANLSSSFDGVLALHRMMKSDEPGLKRGGAIASVDEKDLQAMVRDPRYWRDRDGDFIGRVTAGFRRLFPD